MRALLSTLAVAGVLYAGLCLIAFLLQRRLVYFPGPAPEWTPARFGLAFDDVFLDTADEVRVHGWFLPAEGARAVVLVCHGNAGNIAQRLDLAAAFLRMGLSVFLLEYRGYGRSTGEPSEKGTYLDAEAAYDHLRSVEGFPDRRIVVYGESLGGGVAVELARRRPVAALVLESTPLSVPEVGARAYPFLPVRWLARIHYDSASKVGEIEAPMLFLHSPDDEIVPFDHAVRLYQRARGEKELVETSGGHNDGGFVGRETSRARVRDFLQRALGEQKPSTEPDEPSAPPRTRAGP